MTTNRGSGKTAHVTTACGELEGTLDAATGVRSFKGIPFAEPPLGELRWKSPAPPRPWNGMRQAVEFGARPMQNPVFDDMVFRSGGMDEDCLYLNVWTPASPGGGPLPVMVYLHGGGFVAGDGSEPRYDGASMARRGMVAVTVNYRLGVFGFLAHPELGRESFHHAEGNWGLLDQQAALVWIRDNIAAFGGDPLRVTIAGESAGASSVSAHMASPLSRGLFAGAIGESGSMLGPNGAAALDKAKAAGAIFAASLGLGKSQPLAALREVPATALLEASGRKGIPWFGPVVDGWFLPRPPSEIYEAREQAHVPLLAGSNAAEGAWGWLMGDSPPTVAGYRSVLRRLYGKAASEVFRAYPAQTNAAVKNAARDLSTDRFIAHSTWGWLDLATWTGGRATWYYLFKRSGPRGASHSAEIEYALGNLKLIPAHVWKPGDFAVSRTMQGYFSRFIRTGDPNGRGLPPWPRYSRDMRMVIDVRSRAEPVRVRARYGLLDRLQDGH